MEIKYTTDGRKVVVLGNLNAQDKIVQEVFIVNGIEIPSGANFVVSSLHDAPAVSWKEKQIKDWSELYEKSRKDFDRNMEEMRGKLRTQQVLLSEHLAYVGKALKNVAPASFDLLVGYLTGSIKYVVLDCYEPKIVEFETFFKSCDYDNRKLKLISLFGDDDGTLTYQRHNYSDSSGSAQNFFPFLTYDEAHIKLEEILLSKNISETLIKVAQEYKITLDNEKVKAWSEKQKESIQKNIDSIKANLSANKEKLKALDNL